MKRSLHNRAFTIIELLVVVSIIALLIGILLPAIGKARDQAQLTRSQANIKQLGAAAATYAAEWADRQVTWVDDSFSRYGIDGIAACNNFVTVNGVSHPRPTLGTDGAGITWVWGLPNDGGAFVNGWRTLVPIDFDSGFGAFRLLNMRAFSQYVNNRFYDPLFYAPKDTVIMNSVEAALNAPGEFTNLGAGNHKWSSYCFSPAGMFNPDVLGRAGAGPTPTFYNDPFQLPAGFRSPGLSQAQYPSLKTHITEHSWLQNRKKQCNPQITTTALECEPYYFNHSVSSAPVTLYYDGHIANAGVPDSMQACLRTVQQTNNPNNGLWSKNTPMGGEYSEGAGDGYFMTEGFDWAATSFHILTVDGIKGRDFLPK